MLKSHLSAALRAFRRQPGYAALNLLGLSIGFAAAFLILFAVQDELSMDQMHSDNLYTVLRNASHDAGETVHTWTAAPKPLAAVMASDYPEVAQTGFQRYEGEQVLASGERQFWAEGYWFDGPFFEMFAFPLLAGDPATALSQPDGIVLTESMATKLFGADAAPEAVMGRAVRFNDHEARVTGVAADLPGTSSMDFEWIMPATEFYARNEWIESWDNNAMTLYVTLRDGADIAALNRKMSDILVERGNVEHSSAFVQRYSERYLHGDYDNGELVGGRIETVRTFSIIAFLLLALAGINFTNLATARATRRADEIGVRKALGATRASLMRQFLGESVLMALIAFGIAAVLFAVLASPFGALLEKDVSAWDLNGWVALGFLAAALGAGIVAGLYPAVVLSGFSPTRVLRGGSRGGLALRRGLVVMQFTASVVLIIGTLAVASQLRFIQNRDIGLDRENLAMVPLRDGAQSEYGAFRESLLSDPSITHVGSANSNPMWMGSSTDNVVWEGKDPEISAAFFVMSVDTDALDALGMTMADGRAFSPEVAADSGNYIINEAAARLMGLDTPVGDQIALWDEPGEVVGVVKDFHMGPATMQTEPTVFWLDSPEASNWVTAFVRIAPGRTDQALAHLAITAETFSPSYPLDTIFLDDEYDRFYQSERQLGTMASVFSAIAALIAALGLIGLAAYAAEQRRKEVGVRRVLGASITAVVGLLSRDFILWVLLACAIAIPVAALLVERWLSGFAYRVEMGAGPFVLAALAALTLALLAAGSQALRAARADPIHALRSE